MSDNFRVVDFGSPVQALIPGAQGRLLAVLAETTAELNLRTLARLAGVSLAQASRIMPQLTDLGIVERRDVPPSILFRLVPDHIASQAVLALAMARATTLDEMARRAAALDPPPASIIVYGSLARGTATAASDIDVAVVRPAGVDEDDNNWAAALETWRNHIRRLTGNRIEILEIDRADAGRLLRSRRPLWQDIRRDGIVIYGENLDHLTRRRA